MTCESKKRDYRDTISFQEEITKACKLFLLEFNMDS